MNAPRATYRLQFHAGFTFADAAAIVPYLAELGISHVYASPVMQARPGSTHGYDIVDHTQINPELGGEAGFRDLSAALKQHGLGLILDIVPNHMGVGGADNSAWLSVLEWGELSPSANVFDVDWGRLGAGGKLVVPFLGSRYGETLENGELKLAFDASEGAFSVWHWEHRFPLSPLDYPDVLDRALAALGEPGEGAGAELLAISETLRNMANETDPARRAAFPTEADGLKQRLAAAAAAEPALVDAIDKAVALINGVPGTPESFGALHRLLETQNYRLAHWRIAASDINYRRFFDINALGGIRVEDEEVFARTHELVFRLVREGYVQGLRIDHIDGLADPGGYTEALQKALGPDFYILVEKILEPGEKLRDWPVAGTTGYDALNLIDGVFVQGANARRFERIYRDFTETDTGYGAMLRAAKEEILETSFASELEVIVSDLKRIADADRNTRDYTTIALRRAATEIIARFPVYRTYIGAGAAEPEDAVLVVDTLRKAKRWSALPDRSVHDFIAAALLGGIDTEGAGRPAADDVLRFRRRFQQLTGPVMAKSLEDTLFYRYVRLLSLNEVGGDPGHFGVTPEEFHRANAERAQDWPGAMLASATHDTKRGEDARARLNALSEIPDDWAAALETWQALTSGLTAEVEGEIAPDATDQYMLLQSILGAWPPELLQHDDTEIVTAFRERVLAWAEKALREAKRHTSWVNVGEDYEAAMAALIGQLLVPGSAFLGAFRALAGRLAGAGAATSLARTVLKLTLPGVPDTYQGTEFFDFSLVDPDNRRPVDFAARQAALAASSGKPDGTDAGTKLWLTARLLHDRAAAPQLYRDGGYTPLPIEGTKAGHVVAFMREVGGERLAVIVPRLTLELSGLADNDVWEGTRVAIPAGSWHDVLMGEAWQDDGTCASLFADLPAAVLRSRQ